MADVAELSVLLRVRDEASASLKSFSASLRTVGRQTRIAGQNLLMVSGPILGIGAVGLKAAATFESSFAKVKRSTKLSEAQFKMLAKGIKLMSTQVRVSVKDLGQIAAAANEFGVKGAADVEAFTRMVADLVTATGMSAEEATKALGQRLSATVQVTGESFDELLKRTGNALVQSGDLAGDAAAQYETVGFQVDNLKNQGVALAASIGDALVPMLKQLILWATPIIESITKWVSENQTLVKGVAIVAGVVAALGTGLVALGLLLSVASVAAAGFGVVLAIATSPVTLIIGAIALLAAGIWLLWQNWDKVTQFVSDVFHSRWAWLLPGGALVKAIMAIVENWDTIWGTVKNIWDSVTGFIADTWNSGWGWLRDTFGDVVNGIKTIWNTVWDGIKNAWDTVTGAISGMWNSGWGWLTDTFSTVVKGVKAIWDTIWGAVSATFNTISSAIAGVWNSSWGWLTDTFSTVVKGVKAIWDTVWGGIQTTFETITDHIISAMRIFVGVLADLLSAVPGNILGSQDLADKLRKFANERNERGYATGGVVPGPVGMPQIATVHGGEEILTPRQRGARGSGGSLVINITGNNIWGDLDMQEVVLKALRQADLTGGLGFMKA